MYRSRATTIHSSLTLSPQSTFPYKYHLSEFYTFRKIEGWREGKEGKQAGTWQKGGKKGRKDGKKKKDKERKKEGKKGIKLERKKKTYLYCFEEKD